MSAHADGNSSGGGGAQIESAFRVRASNLIDEIAHRSAANALCPADLMRSALNFTKIDEVNQVIDPATGKAVNKDAWTVPGDVPAPGQEPKLTDRPGQMQLLGWSWDRFLNHSGRPVDYPSVDALILHEVYRATGRCNDDTQQISSVVPAILQRPRDAAPATKLRPSKDSKIYKLAFKVRVDGWLRDYGYDEMNDGFLCQEAVTDTSRDDATCLRFNSSGGGAVYGISQFRFGRKISNNYYHWVATVESIADLGAHQFSPVIFNQLKAASASRPFILTLDPYTGQLLYGPDMDHLREAELH